MSKHGWVERQRAAGWRIVAVELAEDAIQLPRLGPAGQRTVLLLGRGASLNVAFAGSLVLYWLAGMA